MFSVQQAHNAYLKATAAHRKCFEKFPETQRDMDKSLKLLSEAKQTYRIAKERAVKAFGIVLTKLSKDECKDIIDGCDKHMKEINSLEREWKILKSILPK
jgi:hypothetical protein